MGGGKGGKSTTTVQIPAWLQEAAQKNLARADVLSTLGYVPYYGPDVAAFTPMQQAAMEGTNQAALAFGMPAPTSAMAGLPMAQTFAGGLQGYSSMPLYEQSLQTLQAARPGQYAALQAPFINPITGEAPLYPFGMAADPNAEANQGPTSQFGYVPPYARGGSGSGGGAEWNRVGSGGGGGDWRSSQLGASLPGGVNTRNPGSIGNQIAAGLTSGRQSAPTAADRPAANPRR